MRFSSLLCLPLVVLMGGPWVASAEKLAYFSPTPRYEMEIRPTELILRTGTAVRILKRNECNNAFIDEFIRETRLAFEKNPSARGNPQRPYAEWNGKRRLVFEALKRSPLPRLPEHFLTLITRDRQQCR